jgi:lipopolysaccharide biosynthesis glycosyltransferase
VVSSTDNNYAQHLGVMLTSLLENTTSKENIEIYILDGGISSANKDLLSLCVAKHGCNIQFLPIEPEAYEKFAVRSYFGPATYFRLFLPKLFNDSIEKVIYLDCDIVVKRDILELWRMDVSQYFVAAALDVGNEYNGNEGLELKRNLGIPGKAVYFNAGVMVINLAKWREHHISEKIIGFIQDNPEKIVFCDQDGLNAILYNQWLALPVAWNLQTTFFELLKKKLIVRDDIYQGIQNPQIIHYTTSSKPWHYMNNHPLKKEYYRYLKMTAWKDFVPADRTWVNILAQTFVGKIICHYLERVKYYYQIDKQMVPETVNRLFLFKLLYLILFPFGFFYLFILFPIARASYYMENRHYAPGIFKNRILFQLLYLIIFPARYFLPQYAKDMAQKESLHRKTCPCCGYKTLREDLSDPDDACPICFWKDDPAQSVDPDYEDGSNAVSLRQAQQNFINFQASELRFLRFVRKPLRFDEKDEVWKPLR